MEQPSKKSVMDEDLDLFLRSCFPSNWGEASWGVEIFRLRHLDEEHLNKAKAAILAGLERHEGRPISAALELNLTEAIPLLKQWLQKSLSEKTQLGMSGHLAYALYKLTKDESYTPILVDAVRNAGYSYDYPGGIVTSLGEVPLTFEAIEAVWQRLARGKVIKHPSAWRGDCIRFLKEKIRHPVGESFLRSLPESEQKELLASIAETDHQEVERRVRWEKYLSGSDRYRRDEINKFGEYIKVGGSPIQGMTLKHLWKGHPGEIHGLEWSPDGKYLASLPSSSAEELDAVRIWDLALNRCIQELHHPKRQRFDRYEPRSLNWVSIDKTYLAVTYNYRIQTSTNNHNKISVWDVEAEKIISSLYDNGDAISVSQLLRFPDGKTLLYNNWMDIYLIDVATGYKQQILEEYSRRIRSIAVSPDGNIIAVGYYSDVGSRDVSHEILFFDMRSRKVINKISTGHLLSISTIAWIPDRRVLAAASADNTISIWDLGRNRKSALLEGHAGNVNSLSFSANGALLASKSENDQLLQIWRTDTWQAVIGLKEISRNDSQIAFHPSLPILVSVCRQEVDRYVGDLPRSIRIWEFNYEQFLGNPSLIENFNRMEDEQSAGV